MTNTRRGFIKNSGLAAAGIGLTPTLSTQFFTDILGANERINVGLIGCRNHGFNILKKHLNVKNVECIALCDVDANVLAEKTTEVENIQGKKPKGYHDFRKFLENKDIDAVIIGTPDHWHTIPFVNALQAGKDIYVEKPIANSIEECNIMRDAAHKYNKQVVQVGQQQNSGQHWHNVMDYIKSGKLGKLRRIKIWGNFGYGVGRAKVPDSPVPEGVDFNFWLGPAPERTFNASRFHGSWRMFWDYGGGLMTDWGVHLIDMALWAKNIKTPPAEVTAYGGLFSHPEFAHETPDTLSVVYKMDDFALTWEHTAGTQHGPYDKLYGLAFTGNNGTLVVNRAGWQVFPEWGEEDWKMDEVAYIKSTGEAHQGHVENFISCIKTRETPNCTIDQGWLAALYAHIANLSWRTGSSLKYDAEKNIFTGNPQATAMIKPEYRAPWKLPYV